MTTQPAFRFGQDAPARIQSTASMLLEATSMLPELVPAPVSIPFYPGGVVTGEEVAAAALNPSGVQSWERQPERLDISFRQGDDVVIPLYLQDPENPTLDMSAWEWVAQIRVLPYYERTLVNEFTTDAEYLPPGVPPAYHATLGTTLVKLFLPRELNDFRGCYYWELYSIGPFDFAGYPEPVDWPVDADPWPPTTALRTWLYGLCTIRGRTTDTDLLPDVAVDVIPVYPEGWNGGWFVGPNGRVP